MKVDLDNIVALAAALSKQQGEVEKIDRHLESVTRRALEMRMRFERCYPNVDLEHAIRLALEIASSRDAVAGVRRNLDEARSKCEQEREALRRAAGDLK